VVFPLFFQGEKSSFGIGPTSQRNANQISSKNGRWLHHRPVVQNVNAFPLIMGVFQSDLNYSIALEQLYNFTFGYDRIGPNGRRQKRPKDP
jgi:hypothetical protein